MVATAKGRRRRKAGRGRRKKPLICPPVSPARPGAGAAGRRGTAGGREQGDGRHGVPPGALSGRPPTDTAPCSGRPTAPGFPRATPPQGQRRDRLPRGGTWAVWATWEPSSCGAAVSQAAEADAEQCRLRRGRSHRRRPARGRGSLARFLSAPRAGPSGPPGGSAQRATGSPAPPQGRSLPGDLSLLATALPRNAHGHGRQRPFIVALPPPPIRPGAGERAGPESSGCQPPGAERAQSLETSSPCLALRLRWARAPRLCGVQGPRRSAAGGLILRSVPRSVPRSLRPPGRHGTPTGATGRAERPKAAIDWTAARLQWLRSAPVARGRRAAATR